MGEKKANWEAKQWEKVVEEARQRGFKEGVLESEEDANGRMWVKLECGTWREIQGQYFCTLCEKDLTDCSLEAHLNSDKHKRKLAAADESSAGDAAPLEPYCAMVPWDPADPTFLYKKCLLCNKWVQDEHSHSGTQQAPSGCREH